MIEQIPTISDHIKIQDWLKSQEQLRDFERERWMLANKTFVDQIHAERMQAVESVRSFGTLSIKTLFLLNGGAILALLTFTASLFSRNDQTLILLGVSLAKKLITAFYFFGGGLTCAAVLAGIAYVNYSALYSTMEGPVSLLNFLNAKERPPVNKVHQLITVLTARIAVVIACLGLALFLIGAGVVVSAFSTLGVQ